MPPATPASNASAANPVQKPDLPAEPAPVPIRAEMKERLGKPAYQVPAPATNAQAIYLQGMRKEWTRTSDGKAELKPMPVMVEVVRLIDEPACLVKFRTNYKDGFTLNAFRSWAGVVTLAQQFAVVSEGKMVGYSASQMDYPSLSAGLFPLATGKSFSAEGATHTVNAEGAVAGTSSGSIAYQCMVEAPVDTRGPRAYLAELASSVTPLRCSVTSVSNGERYPLERLYYWVESAGCFVPDVNP